MEKHGVQSVGSFRIMPIQRIPRYVMILKGLSKLMRHDSNIYNALNEAYEGINDISMFLNHSQSVNDRQTKLLNIIQALGGFNNVPVFSHFILIIGLSSSTSTFCR